MRRPLVLGTALLIAGLALAGCSAGGSSSVAPRTAPGAVAPGTVTGSGGSDAGTGAKQPGADRSIVLTGTMTLTVGDPLAASSDAVRIVDAAGGRIDARSQTAAGGGATATLTLRIPAKQVDDTVAKLQELGRTDRLQLDASDVTSQSQDLDARITALRTTIQRLLELEQKAAATDDLISIETAVGDRQGQLESLEAQQRDLADQVAMSTITLQLQPRSTAAPSRGTFWDGLVTGWNAFVGFWQGFLVVFGVLLPWLVLTAVVGVAIWLIVRRRTRVARPRS